jgi:quinol monooxygenase YgiN
MLAVFAKCEVIKGNEEKFKELAHNLAEKSRQEEKNISYDILTEVDSSTNEYFFLEKWQDQPALGAHMEMDYFVSTIESVNHIIKGELEIHVYKTV